MSMRLNTAARNNAASGYNDAVNAGTAGAARLQLRSGARPANVGDPLAGDLLAEFDLPNPAFGAPSNGVMSANGLPLTSVGTAAAGAGTEIGHFVALDRDGVVATVSEGVAVEVTDWSVTQPSE